MDINEYENKLEREKKWYSQNTFQGNHFLNSRLFYSPERNDFNYLFPKRQMANSITKIIKANNLCKPIILIAPIGTGDDIRYFKDLADEIYGIDIAEEAVDEIVDKSIKKYVGDIKNMHMFPDNYFDIVVVPLFFHHFCSFCFDDFLKEINRVLKPRGHFFSLEPSSLHPLCWITKLAKKISGNITGLVEDEASFVPFRLSGGMKRCGFYSIRVYSASFSHNRLPIWMARVNNAVTYIFLKLPILKYFGWMCLFYGRKNDTV